MDLVDNQRATSMRASLDAKRELLNKYKIYKGQTAHAEQVEASRSTKLLPASTLNNSKEGELEEEEDAMKNAEVNDSTFRRRLEGLDVNEGSMEPAEVEVLL